MEEKIYFMPGDIVTLKQDIPNKPTMLVLKVETSIFKHKVDKVGKDASGVLKGIKCRWFTEEGLLQEALFNTKDLVKIK